MSIVEAIRSCKVIPGIEVRCVMVTPHIAKKLLESNRRNRKLSPAIVLKYATEMLSNEWFLSSAGIGIDYNGILCDGQHRLHAVVDSGVTVPMLIVFGLAPGSQEKIDRQKRRSLFDVGKIAGWATKPKEVQIATMLSLWNYRKEYRSAGSLTDSEVKACLECHRSSIDAILAQHSFKDKGLGRIGFLSAVVLYYEMAPEKALVFLRDVLTGEMLTLDDPAMRLRRYLLGESGYVKTSRVQGGSGQFLDFRKTVTAINAFHDGRKLSQLKETEDFNIKPMSARKEH